MKKLEVKNLTKQYPSFKLDGVSFGLEQGRIVGFIGRNGAGKTTTLKSIFELVHPDSGEVEFFGLPFAQNQMAVKQRVGFVSGGVDYYPKKKLKTITAVTRTFYDSWDEAAYRRYMELFSLDPNKTPSELSAGMKVKYALTLALSHRAELLVLDEPTSGLDPVSREELLEIFMNLCDEGATILFSTHITSDLDRCADDLVYIKKGRVLADGELKSFVSRYRVIELAEGASDSALEPLLIGATRIKSGREALILAEDAERVGCPCRPADLDAIMVHLEREGE